MEGARRRREDPIPVTNMGWFATCTDNQGNDFGLCDRPSARGVAPPEKDMSQGLPWDMS